MTTRSSRTLTVSGWLLILVVAISAVLSGVNARGQAVQSEQLRRVTECQADVNRRLLDALTSRDGYSAGTNDNLNTLINELLRSPENETQDESLERVNKALTRYFAKAKELNNARTAVPLPNPSELAQCD